MRESIGATFIFEIVIVFILIFVCFLSFAINYSKAYKMRNEVLSIIEKYDGINCSPNARVIIGNYLNSNNYNATGHCPSGWKGFENLERATTETAGKGERYFMCYRELSSDNNDYFYYEVRLFFSLELPFFREIARFPVDGKTNVIKKNVINWECDK